MKSNRIGYGCVHAASKGSRLGHLPLWAVTHWRQCSAINEEAGKRRGAVQISRQRGWRQMGHLPSTLCEHAAGAFHSRMAATEVAL
jgi:hypothetical protein